MGLLIDGDEDETGIKAPTEMNYKVFGNIIIGALGDNIGSSGLLPLCMSRETRTYSHHVASGV